MGGLHEETHDNEAFMCLSRQVLLTLDVYKLLEVQRLNAVHETRRWKQVIYQFRSSPPQRQQADRFAYVNETPFQPTFDLEGKLDQYIN